MLPGARETLFPSGRTQETVKHSEHHTVRILLELGMLLNVLDEKPNHEYAESRPVQEIDTKVFLRSQIDDVTMIIL
jgi:hypothetical protein